MKKKLTALAGAALATVFVYAQTSATPELGLYASINRTPAWARFSSKFVLNEAGQIDVAVSSSQGEPGPAGPQGATGLQGEAGPRGPVGETGNNADQLVIYPAPVAALLTLKPGACDYTYNGVVVKQVQPPRITVQAPDALYFCVPDGTGEGHRWLKVHGDYQW